MDERKMEELLEKAKRMQEEDPEEFARQVEKAKEELGGEEGIQDRLDSLDKDKKEKLMDLYHQAQSMKSTTPEERARLIQEMKDQLSPEDQSKLRRVAKLLKGFMKNK
jgi:hypothetical protein